MSAYEIGQLLFANTEHVDRARLVRYAGASGDFNPIHWNDVFAHAVGLDGVIAHGMLTMGLAAASLEAWVGEPGRIHSFGTRFARPVAVPNPGTAELEIEGKVGAINEDGTIRVDLTVNFEGRAVLARTQAVVTPPAAE